MTFVEKLSGLTRSTDIRALMPEIAQQVAQAEEHTARLRDRLRAAPLEMDDAGVAVLRNEVRASEDSLESLRDTLAGVHARAQQAEATELRESKANRIAHGHKERADLAAAWLKYDQQLLELAPIIGRIAELTRSLRALKQEMGLVVRFPDGTTSLDALAFHSDALRQASKSSWFPADDMTTRSPTASEA